MSNRMSAGSAWLFGLGAAVVASLSGYAGANGQRPLAFSILVNGFEKWKIGKVRRLQNEIAVALVDHANASR